VDLVERPREYVIIPHYAFGEGVSDMHKHQISGSACASAQIRADHLCICARIRVLLTRNLQEDDLLPFPTIPERNLHILQLIISAMSMLSEDEWFPLFTA